MSLNGRRQAFRVIGSGLFVVAASSLGAKTPDMKSAGGVCEVTKNGDGSMVIESAKEESRIKVGNDAFMLRRNTKIELTSDGVSTKTLKLISGAVMGVFGGGEKQIITKTCALSIRGTGLYLHEYGDDAVYACLCYGEAGYYPIGKNEEKMSLKSRYHDKPVLLTRSKSGELGIRDDKTHNHTDDELRELEKMCGRTPPFEEWLEIQRLIGGPVDPYAG